MSLLSVGIILVIVAIISGALGFGLANAANRIAQFLFFAFVILLLLLGLYGYYSYRLPEQLPTPAEQLPTTASTPATPTVQQGLAPIDSLE